MKHLEQKEILYYRRLIRLNSQVFGFIFGLLSGFFIFVATNWLVIMKDQSMISYLQLLGQFLPGYKVSFFGSIIGSVYAFTLGTFLGSLIDRTYKLLIQSRIIQPDNRFVRLLFGEKIHKKNFYSNVYRINNVVLGLEFGLAIGLSIFFATNWLIIKGGHINENGEYVVGPHLQLLNHFFIGYRVSFLGSIIGFCYGFFLGILSGWMTGLIYNGIVRFRQKISRAPENRTPK